MHSWHSYLDSATPSFYLFCLLISLSDNATITRYAYDRVREGQPMLGVIEISTDAPIGQVIEDMLVLLECSQEGEL
ncbi:hypothetical protein PN446_08455 [Microcystis aeruginosa CS-567/02]|nr:hypothetical protein [Microcystis aeruginosa CS-567/02]